MTRSTTSPPSSHYDPGSYSHSFSSHFTSPPKPSSSSQYSTHYFSAQPPSSGTSSRNYQEQHQSPPLSLQAQIYQLTSQIQHLQTQNSSQSLVIKNLSNMLKVLHADLQHVKQDNRTLKRIIFDMTKGSEKYFSSSNGVGTESSKRGTSSSSYSFHAGSQIPSNSRRDAPDLSNHQFSSFNQSNFEDVRASTPLYDEEEADLADSSTYQSQNPSGFFNSTSSADAFAKSNHPTKSTHSYLFGEQNSAEDRDYSEETEDVFDDVKERDTFRSTHDGLHDADPDVEVDTSYSFQGREQVRRNLFKQDYSVPSSATTSPEYDEAYETDDIFSNATNNMGSDDPDVGVDREEDNLNNTQQESFQSRKEGIRSPFIHDKFKEFVQKHYTSAQEAELKRAHKSMQEMVNDLKSRLNTGAREDGSPETEARAEKQDATFEDAPSASDEHHNTSSPTPQKTPKTPKRTNVAFNTFTRSFSSPLFGESTKESSEPSKQQGSSTPKFQHSKTSFSSPPHSSKKKSQQFSYDLESDDEDLTPYCRLKEEGKRMFNEGRYSEAYAKFTESLGVNRNDQSLHASLCYKRAFIALKMMRNYSLCLSEATKAIELNRSHYKAYLCRGDCHLATKNYAKAVEDFRAARNLRFTELARARLKYAKRLYREKFGSSKSSSHKRTFTRSSSSGNYDQSKTDESGKKESERFTKKDHHEFDSSQSEPNKENKDTSNKNKSKSTEKEASEKTYYEMLEIANHTTDERTIKKAYRKMARKWHPDRFVNEPEKQKEAEEMFKDISKAYRTLKDAQEKLKYDTVLLRKRRKRAFSSFL